MARKKGLGIGLSALIEDDLEEKIIEQNAKGIKTIKLTEIQPNPNQPRKHFDEDAIMELSESIKQYGIIQPLIVSQGDNGYEIIAGERRWRAATLAGLEEVPAIIKDFSLEEVLEVSLIENIQRENLNAIEEALAYKRLIEAFDLKQDEIAEKVSKSRSTIANTMRLLNLDEQVQQMIVDEMISSGHARALLAIEDPAEQLSYANLIFDEKLSVREIEKLIKKNKKKKLENKTEEKVVDELTPIYNELENNFKEILGTKVVISRRKKNKGIIEIEYYSDEELDRISGLIRTIDIN
jgi:ParB family chromosome partitioning protein